MARKSRKNPVEERISEQKNVAIYVRLSREDIEKRGDSLENQREIAMDYLLTIPELGTPIIYEDNGFTGRNTQRPQFQKMIEDIEQGLIEAVIVKDTSRISRSIIDSGFYIEKFFPLHNIRFISVTDSYDSALDEDGSETAIMPIKNMLHEAHSMDLSNKIKSVKQQSMRDGDCVSSVPPFGYRKSKENHFKLEIDEVSSKVVLELFQRTLDGEKNGTIARVFNDRRELTPLDYYQTTKGKEVDPSKARLWRNHTIEKILTSEVYIGHMVQGTTQVVNGITKKSDKSTWVKVENTHEPLISQAIFAEVQEIVEGNKKKKPCTFHRPNIFVNKLFCACCDKPMSRCTLHRQDGTHFKYKCKSNYLVRKDYCAIGFDNVIWEEELINATCDALDHLLQEADVPEAGSSMAEMCYLRGVHEWEEVLKQCDLEVKKEQVHLKSLYENLVKAVISQQDYLELKEQYEENIKANKLEFQVATQNLAVLKERYEFYRKEKYTNLQKSQPLTQWLVDEYIGKIYIFDPTHVKFVFFEEELDLVYYYEIK